MSISHRILLPPQTIRARLAAAGPRLTYDEAHTYADQLAAASKDARSRRKKRRARDCEKKGAELLRLAYAYQRLGRLAPGSLADRTIRAHERKLRQPRQARKGGRK